MQKPYCKKHFKRIWLLCLLYAGNIANFLQPFLILSKDKFQLHFPKKRSLEKHFWKITRISQSSGACLISKVVGLQTPSQLFSCDFSCKYLKSIRFYKDRSSRSEVLHEHLLFRISVNYRFHKDCWLKNLSKLSDFLPYGIFFQLLTLSS